MKLIRIIAIIMAIAVLAATLVSCSLTRYTITPNSFEYQSASVPNPMKGFACLYSKPNDDTSLEYVGMTFDDVYSVENGQGKLKTDYINHKLEKVAGRGNTAILRVYMVYPGYNVDDHDGLFMPEELYNELKANGAIYSNLYEKHKLEYPDFNNERLIEAMLDFIAQFGAEYDGNPAIATVQMGLYGSWGEWNLSGCTHTECIMTNENLNRLIVAYTQAFPNTKLMCRNPSLGYAHNYEIGYHDDNFIFNTSDFHTQSAEWKSLLEQVDSTYGTLQQFYDFINGENGNYEPIWDKWKTQMFGGEISGLMYNDPFGPLWSGTEREVLDYCIQQFHLSWIMGVGRGGIPKVDTPEYQEYLKVASSFGYEIAISSVETKDRTGKIITTFTNHGTAPFYYDWELEYLIVDAEGNTVYTETDTSFHLSEVLPDTNVESTIFLPEELEAGDYTLCLHFVNPAKSLSDAAKPLRLSNNNETMDGIYQIASFTSK